MCTQKKKPSHIQVRVSSSLVLRVGGGQGGAHSGQSADHDRSEATCIGPSVVEPGLATGCNYWSYSEVCGT